jgi:hypothetical protein
VSSSSHHCGEFRGRKWFRHRCRAAEIDLVRRSERQSGRQNHDWEIGRKRREITGITVDNHDVKMRLVGGGLPSNLVGDTAHARTTGEHRIEQSADGVVAFDHQDCKTGFALIVSLRVSHKHIVANFGR